VIAFSIDCGINFVRDAAVALVFFEADIMSASADPDILPLNADIRKDFKNHGEEKHDDKKGNNQIQQLTDRFEDNFDASAKNNKESVFAIQMTAPPAR